MLFFFQYAIPISEFDIDIDYFLRNSTDGKSERIKVGLSAITHGVVLHFIEYYLKEKQTGEVDFCFATKPNKSEMKFGEMPSYDANIFNYSGEVFLQSIITNAITFIDRYEPYLTIENETYVQMFILYGEAEMTSCTNTVDKIRTLKNMIALELI